jgi:hypothetical protein
MRAAILELESRASDEITRRRRHEHLGRTGAGGHARADLHSDSARLFAAQPLDLASMYACAHVEAELTQRVANLKRAEPPVGLRA